ncbi:hypothetical protein QE250_12650 [Chromatiaceae bacterium AAb-1]|nr:hypothetical protein [Chromatiaceae bacterium AAb-1]
MRNGWCLIWVLFSVQVLTVSATEQASQHFSYRFNHNQQPYLLEFSLPADSISQHFRNFRRFQPQLFERYIWRDLQQHAAAYAQVKLQPGPSSQRLKFTVHSSDTAVAEQLRQELTTLTTQRWQHYLQQEYYYQMAFPTGQQVFIPDHPTIMQQSTAALQPVAAALQQHLTDKTPRETAAFISSWIQQIPYHPLADRHQGSGFNPPLKILTENRGDCDSKAVLLAALLQILLPEQQTVIIYLPEHAMLGIALEPEDIQSTDENIRLDGVTYTLLDPTGPALLQPGEITPEHRIYTRNSHVAWRIMSAVPAD